MPFIISADCSRYLFLATTYVISLKGRGPRLLLCVGCRYTRGKGVPLFTKPQAKVNRLHEGTSSSYTICGLFVLLLRFGGWGFFFSRETNTCPSRKVLQNTGDLWVHGELTKSLEKKWVFKHECNKLALSWKRVRCHWFVIWNKKGAIAKI